MAASRAGRKAGLGKGAAECQERRAQREKCQDINANERQWRDGDTGRGCSGDDDSAAGGSEKPPQSPGCRGNTHGMLFTQDEGVQYKLVPPEGGWGWMVVLGTFIIVTLLPSLGPSFGVLFSEYLLGSGSSSTNTAWIFNLQCFLWFISGILTRPLTQELGWRPVGLIGSVMASVGIMLSAVTPNPNFLFFSFSVLTAFTFSTTSEQLLACMATYGVGVGACMGIYNIVIIDVMGVDLLATVFGASSFCTAIGFICIGPLIGLIRDVTQSYTVSMRITAGMLLLSLLAWMFMDLAERVDRRREAAKAVEEKL